MDVFKPTTSVLSLKYNSLHKHFVHDMKDYDVSPCKFNLIQHFRSGAINPMRERMHVGLSMYNNT